MDPDTPGYTLVGSVERDGVLWQTWDVEIEVAPGRTTKGQFTRAVCRPESCADGHRCGLL